MNKQEAESMIRQLVTFIDQIRVSPFTDEGKVDAVARIDALILDLKKITGPREITGTAHIRA